MSPAQLIAIVAGIVLPLQGATFFYVISIEHRITRIESIADYSNPRGRLQKYEEAKQ